MGPECLWSPPIVQDEQPSAPAPTREMAQAYVNRLYEALEMRAGRHIIPFAL
jgi:hypothetical protein